MSAGVIAGLAVGIIAAVVAAYLVMRERGYFQYLGGAKRSSIPPVNKETLMGRLLDLNDLSMPFSMVEGMDTDLVAEWKPAKPGQEPSGTNNQASLAYRAQLFLDESRHAIRCYEEIGTFHLVQTGDGWQPQAEYRRRVFANNDTQGSLPEETPPDRFDIRRIRRPLLSVIRESGWEWVPVRARRHAVYPHSPAR